MASLSNTLGTGGLENSAFFFRGGFFAGHPRRNLFDAYQVAGRPSGYSTQSAFSQESFEMIYNGSLSSVGRCVASLMIATLVVTTSELPLMAAPAARAPHGILATAGTSDATDFSAARRRRHYRREATPRRWLLWGWRSEQLLVQLRLNDATTTTTMATIMGVPIMVAPITARHITAAGFIIVRFKGCRRQRLKAVQAHERGNGRRHC